MNREDTWTLVDELIFVATGGLVESHEQYGDKALAELCEIVARFADQHAALEADAALGRMVREMGENDALQRHGPDQWTCMHEVMLNELYWTWHPTPEEALREGAVE